MVASTAARKEMSSSGSSKFSVKKSRPKHFSVWQPGSAPTPFQPSNEPSNFRPINRAAASLNHYAGIFRHTHGSSAILKSVLRLLLVSYHSYLLKRYPEIPKPK